MTTVRINANKIALATALATGTILLAATDTSGAVRCETQYGVPYGAREVCVTVADLTVNKEVFDPVKKRFVDNLGLTDHHFAPGEEITFRIKVKNVSDHTLGKVEVHDNLPQFIEKVSGDFTYDLVEFRTGQEDVRSLKARVVSADKLPADQSVICDDRTKNEALAKAGEQQERDTSQVCVEKKAVKELPKAGPEDILPTIIGSVLAGFIGLKLFGLRSARKSV